VRERPSKSYSWRVFLLSNVLAELPYQVLMGVIVFAVWNYTVLGIQEAQRAGLVLLFICQFFIWASTYAHMVIAALPNAETGAMLAVVMFILSLLFSGVLQPPGAMPKFWLFLWRASPMTYWVSGVVATGLHGRSIQCSTSELSVFSPPSGRTCAAYLQTYLQTYHAPGYLLNPNATAGCQYCPLSTADQFLARSKVHWEDRWRNFGLLWCYIGFNVVMTVVLYWLFRVGGAKKILGGLGRKKG
jgi:ATP-binding cassette, subfamily G (WHITE), member 2, PDR